MAAELLSLSDLVLDALETALQLDDRFRLTTSGKKTGLLPGGPATPAKKDALAQCLSVELGLFDVSEVEEGKGKIAARVPYVSITRRGIEALFSHRSPVAMRELLDKCANPHKEIAQDVAMEFSERELERIAGGQKALNERAADLRAFLGRVVTAQLEALAESRRSTDQQAAAWRALVEAAPGGQRAPERDRGQSAVPHTDGDLDFQLHLCRELVFAWEDASDPEVRSALEPVLMNAGLDPVGEVGQIVEFDNSEHRADVEILPGDRAQIVAPGWKLVSSRGVLLIAPAQVSLRTQVPAHVPHA